MIGNILRISIAALLVVSFLFPAIHYADLPQEIPIHYNALGEADDYAKKSSIWLLPILNLLNLLLVFALGKGAALQGDKKVQTPYFSEIIGLYVGLIMTYLEIATVLVALGIIQSLGVWFLPFVGLLTLVLIILLYRRK